MYSDLPIESAENDALNRAGFAQMISHIVLETETRKGGCIGLMGPWGSGKTSLLNMAIEDIESKRTEGQISIMRFEPWNFTSSEEILSQFFLQLAELFNAEERGKGKIGKAISEYASVVDTSLISAMFSMPSPLAKIAAASVEIIMRGTGKAISEMEFENKSMQKQKEIVQKLLEKTQEKIVIVIDDIDRLTDDQIRSVFQLVTVICKFPNIVYILAFDRAIVAKALDRLQNDNGNEFLDKIIQVPLTVPPIGKEKLFSIMADYLQELMDNYGIKVSDQKRWNSLYLNCASQLIKTQRDVVRLCNGIHGKLLLIANEVDFEDLIVLTIIEQHEPALYDWIRNHGEMLTGQFTYEPFVEFDHRSKDNAEKEKNNTRKELDSILMHKDSYSVDFAIQTLSMLFPAFAKCVGNQFQVYEPRVLRERRSVGHPRKYERYFSLCLGDRDISSTDVDWLMNEAEDEEIKNMISKFDEDGKSIELLDDIKVKIDVLNEERTKKLVFALEDTGEALKSESSNGLFPRYAFNEALNFVNDLIYHRHPKEMYDILTESIDRMTGSNVNLISGVMYKIVVNGLNSHNQGEEALAENEVSMLKDRYRHKLKAILEQMPATVLVQKGWMIETYKHFPEGSDYLKSRISSEPRAILEYLCSSFLHYRTYGEKEVTEIKVTKNYLEMIDDEKIENSIKYMLENEGIEALEKKTQRSIAAYLIVKDDPSADWEGIDSDTLDEKLKELLM